MTPKRPVRLCVILLPPAEAWIVDGREVVFEADAGADRTRGKQDGFEDAAVVVAARVVE